MVARINSSKSISRALNYNEQKVKQGKAEILSASGFIKDADRLSFYDKISQFQRHISLNERTLTNTLHLSLNFDPSEKLPNKKLVEIANSYMQKIGFGSQPYLVYRHYDSGHPHIHIVSTNIEKNGSRISMHNLGRNQSEKARKEIEIAFNLVKAQDKKYADTLKLVAIDARRVIYGKSETRRAIANVLGPVINQYKFTSIAELNAVLGLYHITADQGREGSRIYLHKGLTFRILDEYGNKVGVPQKASSFFMKPTLANLQKKFTANESLRSPYKKRLQTTIGWILNKQPASIEAFMNLLEKENISMVLRTGKEGVVYGITYVDHKTKCVFNGSDLGKAFSAKAVLEKCRQETVLKPELLNNKQVPELQAHLSRANHLTTTQPSTQQEWNFAATKTWTTSTADYIPHQLKKKRKKKRKRLSI